MKTNIILVVVLLMVSMSCMTQVLTDDLQSASTGNQNLGPYPKITRQENSDEMVKNDWNCGFEVIVIKLPNDELIISEIPLECDPLADKYLGDPSPMNEKKSQ